MNERWKPSVTVAAVPARVRAGDDGGTTEYLLVEEETAEGLRLNNPAGHLEAGESLIDAVVREALEETACAFVPAHVVGVYLTRLPRPDGGDVTYLRFAFAGTVGDADPSRALDRGIVRTLWLTLAEVHASQARHRTGLVLRCIEDCAAGRAFALDALVADETLRSPSAPA